MPPLPPPPRLRFRLRFGAPPENPCPCCIGGLLSWLRDTGCCWLAEDSAGFDTVGAGPRGELSSETSIPREDRSVAYCFRNCRTTGFGGGARALLLYGAPPPVLMLGAEGRSNRGSYLL